MNFNEHLELYGKHAFLSASSYHWLNYDTRKLEQTYINHKRKEEGTALHEFASFAIIRRIKVANLKKALNLFINDAIGFQMDSEKILYYSDNCFGTVDAISFNEGVLRIHDLKTGITDTSFKQLDIYTALFCLEYGIKPHQIEIEQRIYQGNGFKVNVPDPKWIKEIMKKIIVFDKELNRIQSDY